MHSIAYIWGTILVTMATIAHYYKLCVLRPILLITSVVKKSKMFSLIPMGLKMPAGCIFAVGSR